MDMFERDKMVRDEIRERDIAFHEKAKQYEWDYMTDWSELSFDEKYAIVADDVDYRLEMAEARDFLSEMANRIGDGAHYIDRKKIDENYLANCKRYPALQEYDLNAALIISSPDIIEILTRAEFLTSKTMEGAAKCFDEGGEFVLISAHGENGIGFMVCAEYPSVSEPMIQEERNPERVHPARLLANMLCLVMEDLNEKHDEKSDSQNAVRQ